MKILVFGHHLVVGGTSINSIELAAALRDIHGHDVAFFATPGPMLKLLQERGLRYIPAPEGYIHPSPARVRAVREVVLTERPDVVHVWDWFQCLEAFYPVHLAMRVPLVVTDMFMTLTRVLPKALPTTFGTPVLVDQAKAAGRKRVELLLPPVDVQANAPGVVDPDAFREAYGIDHRDITLVTVSRLNISMKFESLARTIDAVGVLGSDLPLRFVIVGDGGARATLEELASKVNERLARPAIVFTGEMLDPRPAYASADIVIGMGGSALRGMAFGKPVIVVGEEGFSAAFTPETAETFYYHGIYGRGGNHPGNSKLVADIRSLAEARERFQVLGDFSRQFVVRHFSLEAVSTRLSNFCRSAVDDVPAFHLGIADGLRSAAVYMRERLFLRRSVDMARDPGLVVRPAER